MFPNLGLGLICSVRPAPQSAQHMSAQVSRPSVPTRLTSCLLLWITALYYLTLIWLLSWIEYSMMIKNTCTPVIHQQGIQSVLVWFATHILQANDNALLTNIFPYEHWNTSSALFILLTMLRCILRALCAGVCLCVCVRVCVLFCWVLTD